MPFLCWCVPPLRSIKSLWPEATEKDLVRVMDLKTLSK
jgi:hypothetical protein